MTFGEFKQNLACLLAGDSAARKDDAVIKASYKRAVGEVIRMTEPLSLITADRERFKPVRILDGLFFIRHSACPENDDDLLDVDEGLHGAVLNLTASYITRDKENREAYVAAAAVVMDVYTAESFTYLQNVGFYEANGCPYPLSFSGGRIDIPMRLDEAGYLKFYYTIPLENTGGWRYHWQYSALDSLDEFMLNGIPERLSVSEKALWEQYSSWADTGDDPEANALKGMDEEYLGLTTR